VGGQRNDLAALPPGERADTHFTGGWVWPWGEKYRPHGDWIPGPSSPYQTRFPGQTQTQRFSTKVGGICFHRFLDTSDGDEDARVEE